METVTLKFVALPHEQSHQVPAAIECTDGSRIPLTRPDWLRQKSPSELSSYEPPILALPDLVELAQHKARHRPDTIEFWRPVAEALAYSTLAPLMFPASSQEDLALPAATSVSIPKTNAVGDLLAAISRFHQVAEILRLGWTWVQSDLAPPFDNASERRTTTLPPIDLLPELARRAEFLEDPECRLLVLGVAHAVGQESVFLHAGWGQPGEERSPDRQKFWYSLQERWLSFLEQRLERTVRVRVVLTGNGDWERFATSWLPAASLRAVGVQLKRNLEGRIREDFVTRLGMALPWIDATRWATKTQTTENAEFCDAWPCPLDHLQWWQRCLEAIALKLFEGALRKSEASPLDVLDFEIPFYRQSLAATLAVARPLGQNQGKGALTAASSMPLEVAAAPNYLMPHLARLISRRRVVRTSDFNDLGNDPSNVAEGVATPVGPGFSYPNVALVLPNAKPDLDVEFSGIRVTLPGAGQNLATSVKWATGQMKIFRRFQHREAEMFLWWRDLLLQAPTNLEFAFGSGWPWNPAYTMKSLTSVDYPPSARCKLGWLSWVIAMWARNEKLPPSLLLPTVEELDAVGVEDELSYEAKDVMALRAGTPEEMDPFHNKRHRSRGRPLRILSLQGWFAKAAARDRILQWLPAHQPQQGNSFGFFFAAVCCSIAAARWVHEMKDRRVVGVLRHMQQVAERQQDDDDATNGAAWLNIYLNHMVPFPTR